MKVLITGGAGFVGYSLAKLFRENYPKAKIVCLDNLKRRGSEYNLQSMKLLGIDFVHGDIRNEEDLNQLDDQFDLFIEASAEPSVQAGLDGAPLYLIHTNLSGTIHCLEYARKNCQKFIFLSTSRVYSIDPLKEIPLTSHQSRFVVDGPKIQPDQGYSEQGISEEFSTDQFRSLYGATKLSSELMIQEYAHAYGLDAIINRCGVLAGEGQWGKTDQGVYSLWVARHYFEKNLKYTGFGGEGFQVRDLLHPQDLYRLIVKQWETETTKNRVYNVGGGHQVSTSLAEYTQVCQEVTGKEINIASDPKTHPVDIPYYVSDTHKVCAEYGWRPEIERKEIVERICHWIHENEGMLKHMF